MKEILLLILGGVLANNYAFEKFLGVTPLLGYSRKENKLVALGLSVTGVMLLVAARASPVQAGAIGYSYVMTLAAALVVGLGFLVAMLRINGVQSRIEEKHIPAAFRGLPISLLAASIIAMVLVAFK